MRFMLNYLMMPFVFPLLREIVHKLEVGGKRFVDGISDEQYKSDVFILVNRVSFQERFLTRAHFTRI